jgi:hypothetical protein
MVPNGPELMARLLDRLGDLIEKEHVYTAREIRTLRGALVNVVIPAK